MLGGHRTVPRGVAILLLLTLAGCGRADVVAAPSVDWTQWATTRCRDYIELMSEADRTTFATANLVFSRTYADPQAVTTADQVATYEAAIRTACAAEPDSHLVTTASFVYFAQPSLQP